MCQLLETIKVFQNNLEHIQYHNDRVNRSRYSLYGISDRWDLSEKIKIPDLDSRIVYRCRFLYGAEPEKTEFIPYIRREISKLYAIDCGNLDYSFKFSDRRIFEALRSVISDPATEDILMVKDGMITDASFANIVLYDGTRWHTPDTPLLKGTKRQYYLDNGIIHERKIKWSDIHQYKKARLINAMIDLEESNDILIDQIFDLLSQPR